MEPTKVVEYRGYNIEVHQDDHYDNPREDWGDNFGTMVCFHDRYDLGDKRQDHYNNDEWIENFAGQFCDDIQKKLDWWYERLCPRYEDSRTKYEKKRKEVIQKLLDDNVFMLPLYLYDHSGITMNTGGFSCPWDSGQVGYIYVTKEKVREEFKVKVVSPKLRAKVYKILEQEVKVYDDYLTGNVWGYIIKDHNGNEIDDGSCWGFYGDDGYEDDGYMINECKSIIDREIEELKPIAWKENREHPPLLVGLY